MNKATLIQQMSRQNVSAVVSIHCSSKKIMCPQYNAVDIIICSIPTTLVLRVFMLLFARYMECKDGERHFVEFQGHKSRLIHCCYQDSK